MNVYPNQVERTARSFYEGVRSVLEREAQPVILGGDHYVSLPCCEALAEATRARSGGLVGYIQIGSELGFGADDAVWGSDWAGAQGRRLVERGVVEPANVVLVGVSGFAPIDELESVTASGATIITAVGVRALGPAAAATAALAAALDGCELVYVSVGMDVLDTAHATGTGTTVIGGLLPQDLISLVGAIAAHPRVGALDVVEVAPNLEPGSRTARLAVYVVNGFVGPRTIDETQQPSVPLDPAGSAPGPADS
jgi:agmatinase